MADCMTFPDTVEEFMEQYKVTDTDHVYSNGVEFVPIFRMKQWFAAQLELKNKLISEIEGKTPEETYDLLVWLLNDYGMQFTDSRQAVIEWLRGE